jgi:hypothetical protein
MAANDVRASSQGGPKCKPLQHNMLQMMGAREATSAELELWRQ